jgi:hypothetical protein
MRINRLRRLARGRRPRVPRWASLTLALAIAASAPAAAYATDGGASWQFAPAQAPLPPPGVQPSPYPTFLGPVGDIAFWSPNRGVLITAGNEFVPEGLYAYDGVSWHQLSTVCGGHDGRIAWAGPDELWTISDQRAGTDGASGFQYWDVSLCHFLDGQVVGSYALPVGEADSYRPMDAAACDGPDDCWFGGELGETPDSGAFHLYWNGSSLSVVYSPQDHAVAAMAVDAGQIYESVQIAPGDSYNGESAETPALLHTIIASDPEEIFHDVVPIASTCGGLCAPLPEYGSSGGEPVAPDTLGAFALSSDWSPSGEGPASPQLWAVAGVPEGRNAPRPPGGEASAHPVVLRYVEEGLGYPEEGWTQVVPNLASFAAGEDPQAVAADPGENAAWVTIQGDDETAHVDLLSSANGLTWTVSERDRLGPEQEVGSRGNAGPIACPAPHECWLATDQGWLFHLTDGQQLPADDDPFFDGAIGVIAYRPPDGGLPEAIANEGFETEPTVALPQPQAPPAPAPRPTVATKPPKRAALLSAVHTSLLHGDVLELTFTLSRAARVELVALRDGKVVARTRRETLRRGAHRLALRLSPREWPTRLDVQAKGT